MPTGTLLAASTTLANTAQGGATNGNRLISVMSDNRRLAIYGIDNTGTGLKYRTSADGITWSTAVTVPGTTGSIYIQSITKQGDTLYMWAADSGSPFDIHIIALAYNTGTQLLSQTTHTAVYSTAVAQMDAAWDSTHSVLHTAIFDGSTVNLFSYTPGAAISTAGQVALLGNASSVKGIVCVPGSTSTILVLIQTLAGIFVAPVTYNGSTYSRGGLEVPASGTLPNGCACSLDNANNLDVVWVQSGGLYTRKRTGTNVYGSIINLAGSVGSTVLSLTPNGADLVVLYESVANQTNGEMYLVWRQSGVWSLPRLLAGGDAGGYSIPKSSPSLTSGRMDTLYEASGGVYYASTLTSSAPSAPTISAPSGNETSLTPTITGAYVNASAPSDPMLSLELKVTRVSDSFVMWDSGEMTTSVINQTYGTGSNTGDPNYVAPTSLSYNVQYSLQARTKDVLTSTWGPYSSGTLFTPVQGGTVGVTNIVDNGTTYTSSPSTIGAATITSTDITWSQPQTHTATQYRRRIYANDGVTLVADEGAQTIGGGLASGSGLTLGSWTPALANSTPYKFQVDLLDGTTGLWSSSAQWTLNTSWTAPVAPSAFTALLTPNPGFVTLTWTNPGAGVSVLLEYALAGSGAWNTLYSGALISSKQWWANILVGFDYRVSVFDSRGIQSAYATLSDVELPANGIFGMCLVDSTNTNVVVWFGPVQDWKQASTWDEPSDVQTIVPFGATMPIESFRFLDYSEAKQREFALPPDGPYYDAGGTFSQEATEATFRAMGKAGNPCWYRDVNGEAFYCTVKNIQRSYGQDGYPMRRLQWDMTQVIGPGVPLGL